MGLKTRSQDPPPLYTVLNAKNNFYVFKRLKKLRSTVCCGMRLLRRIQIPGARPVTPGHGRSHRARQFVRWRGCFCTALLVWPAKHTYLFSGSLKGLLTSASEHSLYVHQEWTSFGATGRGENESTLSPSPRELRQVRPEATRTPGPVLRLRCCVVNMARTLISESFTCFLPGPGYFSKIPYACFPTFSKSFFKWHLLSKASPQNPSFNCAPLPSAPPALSVNTS